jgi:hypothetical protein
MSSGGGQRRPNGRSGQHGAQLDEATIDALAQTIHENYRATFAPDAAGWPELSDDLREANRAQARDIVAKLAVIGARVGRGKATRFAFTAAELDGLARAEHERWMAQRIEAGWTYGPVRDNDRKIHPMIVPWEQLSELERDKDRDAVRHIPDVLARVGLRVVRPRGPSAAP